MKQESEIQHHHHRQMSNDTTDNGDDDEPTYKYPNNTNAQWAALLVYELWNRSGKTLGSRHRDLNAFTNEKIDGDTIAKGLSYLVQSDRIGYKKVTVDDENRRVHLYYPIRATKEYLDNCPPPTTLPNGVEIPEGLEPVPRDDYVTDPDDVDTPTEKVDPHDWDTHKEYEPSDETECPYCGKGFDTVHQRAGHEANCPERPDEQVEKAIDNLTRAKRAKETPLGETFGVSMDGGAKVDDYDTSLDDVALPSDATAEEPAESTEAPTEPLPAIADDAVLAGNVDDIITLADADPSAVLADAVRQYLDSLDADEIDEALGNLRQIPTTGGLRTAIAAHLVTEADDA